MAINANVSGGQQITASVGETQIDVSVSGGVGPTGTPGAAASVTVGTVTTGAPGSSASVVNAGTTSAAVLNFTIPAGATGATGATGPQGERGEQGIQGIQGIQGPAGPTGPAGSNATATTDASALVLGILPDARLSANIARTSDVTAAVAAVVGAAPESLNTLQELSAALANDASFATTVTNSLAAKAPLASPTFTGTVSGVTKAMVGLGNVDNTSDANKPVSTAQAAADAAVASAAASDATSKANAAQAAAVQRANHTGTQTASTISDFASAVAAASPAEVLEFATSADFPATGQDAKLYVATDTSRVYSWATNVYAEVGPAASLYTAAHTHDDRYYTESEVDTLLAGKQATGSYVVTTDARLSDARQPTSHAHGNITNAGAIGSTSGQIVVTTTGGVLTTAATISSASVSGLGTVATQNANSVAITGGSINGTAIGATTASTGAFTTAATSGNVGVGTASLDYRLTVQSAFAAGVSREVVVRVGDQTNFYRSSLAYNNSASPSGAFPSQSGGIYWEHGGGFGSSGGFVISTNNANAGPLIFGTADAERMRISTTGNVGIGTTGPTISSGVGLHLAGSTLRLADARTPASATATGNQGEVCWDSSFLYVCIATNTWRRIAHSTW